MSISVEPSTLLGHAAAWAWDEALGGLEPGERQSASVLGRIGYGGGQAGVNVERTRDGAYSLTVADHGGLMVGARGIEGQVLASALTGGSARWVFGSRAELVSALSAMSQEAMFAGTSAVGPFAHALVSALAEPDAGLRLASLLPRTATTAFDVDASALGLLEVPPFSDVKGIASGKAEAQVDWDKGELTCRVELDGSSALEAVAKWAKGTDLARWTSEDAAISVGGSVALETKFKVPHSLLESLRTGPLRPCSLLRQIASGPPPVTEQLVASATCTAEGVELALRRTEPWGASMLAPGRIASFLDPAQSDIDVTAVFAHEVTLGGGVGPMSLLAAQNHRRELFRRAHVAWKDVPAAMAEARNVQLAHLTRAKP